MPTDDANNPLAFLDFSQLCQIIGNNWQLFDSELLHQPVWEGRLQELARIRHRIGHVRRPHRDDLPRVEQTLRDLERGAFIALASYNDQDWPEPVGKDPVSVGWIQARHPTAERLIEHARRQYGTTLSLRVSRRPWLPSLPALLTRAPGVLWHAHFVMRGRHVDLARLWHDSSMAAVRPLLVHVLAHHPGHIELTFAATDDPDAIAEALGQAFDSLLLMSRPGYPNERQEHEWQRRATAVDFRVLWNTGWNIVDETTVPITIFGAGGGIDAVPTW